MNEEIRRTGSVSSSKWTICWQDVPKLEVIYFTQITLIFTIVIVCIIKLSLDTNNCTIWASLLSGCVGYMLPAPTLHRQNEPLLSNST